MSHINQTIYCIRKGKTINYGEKYTITDIDTTTSTRGCFKIKDEQGNESPYLYYPYKFCTEIQRKENKEKENKRLERYREMFNS